MEEKEAAKGEIPALQYNLVVPELPEIHLEHFSFNLDDQETFPTFKQPALVGVEDLKQSEEVLTASVTPQMDLHSTPATNVYTTEYLDTLETIIVKQGQLVTMTEDIHQLQQQKDLLKIQIDSLIRNAELLKSIITF